MKEKSKGTEWLVVSASAVAAPRRWEKTSTGEWGTKNASDSDDGLIESGRNQRTLPRRHLGFAFFQVQVR